jgi:hypothetical protein
VQVRQVRLFKGMYVYISIYVSGSRLAFETCAKSGKRERVREGVMEPDAFLGVHSI